MKDQKYKKPTPLTKKEKEKAKRREAILDKYGTHPEKKLTTAEEIRLHADLQYEIEEAGWQDEEFPEDGLSSKVHYQRRRRGRKK